MSRRVHYTGSDLMIRSCAPRFGWSGRSRMVGERRERSPRPNRVGFWWTNAVSGRKAVPS